MAVLGGGVMGEALIIGLQHRLTPAPTIVVAEKRADRAAELADRFGVEVAASAAAVVDADVVIIVVKPQDIRAVVNEIAAGVADGALVISIAAGITTSSIEEAIPQANVVRAMPNTPARLELGVTGISAGANCEVEALARAEQLLASVGTVISVPETLQDAITAVSGSGPAYVFFLAEAMMAGAEAVGLSAEDARSAVVHTLLGAAHLLQVSGEEPAALRGMVTSPGGTTAAAIAVLQEREVLGAFMAAIEAARDRSRELSAS
ncbi:MAG: pyrroline-5-carboxylate reductase [Candidatus Nanopelagicales bacterium]|nr:pyrroline-5-carboxylate reductase [Candidatus Nanopelagicales bacterium]